MSAIGVMTGVLGLAALEVVLSSDRATGALGDAATLASAAMARVMDPRVGLVPNLHDSSAPMGSAASVTTPADTPSATAAERGIDSHRLHTKASAKVTRKSNDPTAGKAPIVAPAPVGIGSAR